MDLPTLCSVFVVFDQLCARVRGINESCLLRASPIHKHTHGCRCAGMKVLAVLVSLGLACADSCGLTGQSCCDGYCSDANAICKSGTCILPIPGAGVCADKGTAAGQSCCFLMCEGEHLACSQGTCVDTANPVIDQSGPPPGSEGAECVGQYQECDENDDVILKCVAGKCIRRAGTSVQDQSVSIPIAACITCIAVHKASV
jgi:hypothetical protein